MKTKHNILTKIFLILLIAAGWGSSAWAQGAPEWYTIKHNYQPGNTGYKRFLHLKDDGNLDYVVTNTNDYSCIWKFEDKTGNGGVNFVSAKLGDGKIMSAGDADNYATMNPVGGPYTYGSYDFTKTQSGSIWWLRDKNNQSLYFGMSGFNARVRTRTDASVDLVLTKVPNMGTDVTIEIVGTGDVVYNTQCDALTGEHDVTLTNGAHHDFKNMPFLSSLFSVNGEGKQLTVNFDEGTQKLTFTIEDDLNLLQFSDAPANGEWAADTKWFTIHNNKGVDGYLSTEDAGSYLDAEGALTVQNGTDARGNRGGLWTFVEKDGGFNIYNNAYGPDFVLGVVGDNGSARLHMYFKDQVPSNVSTLFTSGENSSRETNINHAYYFQIGLTGNKHLNHQGVGYPAIWDNSKKNSDQGSAFTVTAVSDDELAALASYDVYKVTGISSATYTGSRTIFGKRGSAPYIILSKGAEVEATDFDFGAFDASNFSVTKPANDYIKVISADPALKMKGPYQWYIMKNHKNNTYVSIDDGYVDGSGYLKLTNTTKPDNYAGIWMGVPQTTVDAAGAGNITLINAKYYNSKVLGMTDGSNDGNNRATLYSVSNVPSDVKTVIERKVYTGHSDSYYYTIPGTNHYFNNRSNYLASWYSNDAFGETGSRFVIEEVVPNLDEHVNIVFQNAKGFILPGATMLYTCHRADIPTIAASLTHGSTYNFGNVPYLPSLFTPDNPDEYEFVDVVFDEGTNTLKFTMNQRIPYRVLFTGVTAVAETATAAYRTDAPVTNGQLVYIPEGSTSIPEDLAITAPELSNYFVWGPVINENAHTITYDIRERATELTSGYYQLMLTDDALISGINNKINQYPGNLNTASNIIYLAPSLHHPRGAVHRFTGISKADDEASSYIYIKNNGNGTIDLETNTSVKFSNVSANFADGILTISGYGVSNDTEPMEQPAFKAAGGSTMHFAIVPADLTNYDIYTLAYDFGASPVIPGVELLYSLPTATGLSKYHENDRLILQHGTSVAAGLFTASSNCTVEGVTADDENHILTIALMSDVPTDEWTAVLTTNDGIDLSAYHVVYGSVSAANGATIAVPTNVDVDATTFKTDCTDKFVWGPMLDYTNHTVTFEIRSLATDIVDGWYQIQLLEDRKIADANYRISHDPGNINSVGSYIYVLPMYNNSNSVLGKYGGVPAYAGEASSYFHITRDGASIRIQSPDGRYANSDGAIENGQTEPKSISAWRFNNGNEFQVARWTAPGYWGEAGTKTGMGTNAGNQGPIVASGSGYDQAHYITKVNPTTMYDVYRVSLIDNESNPVDGVISCFAAANHGVDRVNNGGYFFMTQGTTIDENLFQAIGFEYKSVSPTPDAEGIKTITFQRNDVQNTIFHRRHHVYDDLEATDPALRPGEGYIQVGDDMAENEYTHTPIQKTSVFKIDLYVQPGGTVRCVLPYTKALGEGGDQLAIYQRWYDYKTEKPLPQSILPTTSGWTTTTDGWNGYKEYTNGWAALCQNRHNGSIIKSYVDVTFPASDFADDEIIIGVDASDFSNYERLTGGNILEPSLNLRVLFHIHKAEEIADKLLAKTEADEWLEEKTFIVPKVKHGDDNLANNVDLIPLDMPYANYWMYSAFDGDGNPVPSSAMRLAGDNVGNGTIDAMIAAGLVTVTVDPAAAPYIEVGVFKEQGGLKNRSDAVTNNAAANHFLYYKRKVGDSFPIDQADIKVTIKPTSSSSLTYNLAHFTLQFTEGTEPLALASVIGADAEHPISTRSEDYFRSRNYVKVASQTFANKSIKFNPAGCTWEYKRYQRLANRTYAFPFDFDQTSYGYTHANEYSNYKIATTGFGYRMAPVALYDYNIKHPESQAIDIDDDYFMYIDAAEQPGRVATIPLNGSLCRGARLYCYGWMASMAISDYNNGNKAGSASLMLHLVGHDSDGNEHIIASYLPGVISSAAYDKDGNLLNSMIYGRTPSTQYPNYVTNTDDPEAFLPIMGVWQQIGFSFSIPSTAANFSNYEIQIVNNAYSTSGGDYVLDDFSVYMNPPRAETDFTTPLCQDKLRHLVVKTDHDMLIQTSGINTETETSIPVTLVALDKATFDNYEYLGHKMSEYLVYDEESKTSSLKHELSATPDVLTHINKAFKAALIGQETDDPSNPYRAYMSFDVPVDFSTLPLYSYNGAESEKFYANGKVANHETLMKLPVSMDSPASLQMTENGRTFYKTMYAGQECYMVYTTFKLTPAQMASSSLATDVFNLHTNCAYLTAFTNKQPVSVVGDVSKIYSEMPVHVLCESQKHTILPDLPVMKTEMKQKEGAAVWNFDDSHFETIKNLPYDWWIGQYDEDVYGREEEDFRTAKSATLTYPANDDVNKPEGDPVDLSTALEHLRFFYADFGNTNTDWTTLSAKPYNHDFAFGLLDEDIACVKEFVEAGKLKLYDRAMNIDVSKKGAVAKVEDGVTKLYFYYTLLPIIPAIEYATDVMSIYCPEPKEIKYEIDLQAPHMVNGFNQMTYPDEMEVVPIRIGSRQIKDVSKPAMALTGYNVLRIPTRQIAIVGIHSDNTPSANLQPAMDNAKKPKDIYLTGTDDPFYLDADDNLKTEYSGMSVAQVINTSVDKATMGNADYSPYIEVAFIEGVQLNEGFTYQLAMDYEEDAVCECFGTMPLELKVVPEYQKWVGTANGEWTNDQNWARADRTDLHAENAVEDDADKVINNATPLHGYATNTTNRTSGSFVPMYFTNVLVSKDMVIAPDLYLTTAGTPSLTEDKFLGGLNATTATDKIVYDMLVAPVDADNKVIDLSGRYVDHNGNYGCELYWTNVCNGLTFEPATAMYDAQYLTYQRAWVEYELKTNRWYTLASPLQDTYAGEWYSPEDGGRQLTPHFYAIKYNEALNDRFNPAYYQRSWDKAGKAWIYRMNGDEGTYVGFEHDRQNATNVRVQKPIYLNWSYVYNDVTVPYSNGGFSVNVRYTDQGEDATYGKALVRMPKDDDSYLYYQSEASAAVGNTNGQNPDGSDADAGVARPNGNGVYKGDYTTLTRTGHHRLMSDMLRSGSTINQSIVNASASNPYYLIGNPLMAPLDMEKFFQENQQFVDHAEKVKNDDGSPALGQDGAPLETHDGLKYWIMSDGLQEVSMKVNGNWISTNGSDGVVAPLQGFFVRVASDDEGKATATFPNGMQVKYTAEMQKKDFTADVPAPSLRAPRRSDAQPGIFRITATNDSQLESNAVVYFSEQASNRYNTAEDAETLLDGNIADKVSTVFTAADEQALSINSMSTAVSMIPVGVIAPADDTRTTLSFAGLSSLEAVMEGTPHIYDADDDTFMVLDEDTKLTVTGTSVGRYFIVTGTTLPFVDEEAAADDETDGHIYNLNGIRIATPQHGTVTIHGSRKEYNK